MPALVPASILLLLSAAPTTAPTAAPRDPNPAAKELAAVERLPHSMRAALGLWSLRESWDLADGPTRARMDAVLARLGDDRRTPLAVRRLALGLLAERLAARGDAAGAEQVQDRLGWIRGWWIAGPFPDGLRDGLQRAYPPEEEIDLPPTPPADGPTTWRPLPYPPADGRVRLHPLLLPRTGVVAYGLALLELERPRRVLLHLGCDDACKLWVNGREVLTEPGPHPLRPGQQVAALDLPAGANRLLLKLVQDTGSMEFCLAATDPAGRPLATRRLPPGREELARVLAAAPPAPPAPPRPVQGLAAWFEARAKAAPHDPVRLAEAGWALFHTAAGDARARRAEQLLQQAVAESQPGDPALVRRRLWLARVTEDDGRARRQLEQAAGEDPRRPEPWARLGLLHQVRGESDRALAAQRRALRRDPDFLPALIGRAEALYDLGLRVQAEQRMDQLLRRHPDVPEVLTAAANLHRRLGHRDRAAELFGRLLAIDACDQFGLRALHELALEGGELDEALARLSRLQALDPLRTGWWLQRGRLLAANGRLRQGLEALAKAISLCPTDPEPWTVRGELLLGAGRREEARADWLHALELAPQDGSLQRRLEALGEQGTPFYAPWLVEPQRYLAEPERPRSEAGAERLVDLEVVRLHPNGMASRLHQQVVRINDPQGAERFRTFRVEYAPGRQEVRVLRSRHFHSGGAADASALIDDYSLSEPWYNLYYDVHAREITFPDLAPGDVVELTTLTEDTGSSALLGDYFGDLVPLQFSEPVRHGTYVLLAPAGRKLSFNQPPAGVRVESRSAADGTRIHIFRAEDLPAVEPEPAMPGFAESHAYLHLSTVSNWAELSRWFGALIADQLIPGPRERQLASRLTAGLSDPLDRIRAIYRFVADNTRYVGLEFGIHSYVPYRADQVLSRKFGDCKDKSALLVALFRAAGIPARMALVRMLRLGHLGGQADDRGPASLAVFNHAICYLPEQRLWLDGTAALHDVLDLPAQDQGVSALVVGPEGNRLLETPHTDAGRNWTRLDFDVTPRPDGTARLRAGLSISGVLAPEMRLRLLGAHSRQSAFRKIMAEVFPGARVEELAMENLEDPARPLELRARLALSDLAALHDGVLEVPALAKDTSYQRSLAALQSRHHDLLLGPAWAVHWRVRSRIPAGFSLAGLPAGRRLSGPFGTAEIAFTRHADAIEVRADFSLDRWRIEAKSYPAFREFLGQVDRLFSQRLRYLREPHAQR